MDPLWNPMDLFLSLFLSLFRSLLLSPSHAHTPTHPPLLRPCPLAHRVQYLGALTNLSLPLLTTVTGRLYFNVLSATLA